MSFKSLLAYEKSYVLAMNVFQVSKNFPKVEQYSLTDQIRRSSRSVTANIAEAYRKRRYPKHFISKLTDADAENSETQVWLQYSHDCGYLTPLENEKLIKQSLEVGRLLEFMIRNPEKFGSEQLPTATAN